MEKVSLLIEGSSSQNSLFPYSNLFVCVCVFPLGRSFNIFKGCSGIVRILRIVVRGNYLSCFSTPCRLSREVFGVQVFVGHCWDWYLLVYLSARLYFKWWHLGWCALPWVSENGGKGREGKHHFISNQVLWELIIAFIYLFSII